MVLRTWYFCINEAGFERSLPLLMAALASARANTGLRPVALYNGADLEHEARLRALGAEVVRHRSSFEDDLRAGYGERFDAFSGHWLRVDLPLIERQEEVILYTDVDVMFLRHPEVARVPRLLAAAPEFDLSDLGYFSSGVMVLNMARLRRVQSAFVAAIRERLRDPGFRYPAHDQESYNRFFGPTWHNRLRGRAFEPLSPDLNWKPFWGLNDRASIVHFHGPKPRVVRRLEAMGGEVPVSPAFKALWSRSPVAYAAYSAQWERYRRAGQKALDAALEAEAPEATSPLEAPSSPRATQ